MTTEITKRPGRNSDEVYQIAAKVIAPKVKEWISDETGSLMDVESDLIKAAKYAADGYEIAKSLERSGYSPDSELVEILDGFDYARINAHAKLCREWVAANGIKEIPLKTRVRWPKKPEAGIGIVRRNFLDGRSTVAFASMGHVDEGQTGVQGLVVAWEELMIEAD